MKIFNTKKVYFLLFLVIFLAFYFRAKTFFSNSLYVNADDPFLAYRLSYYFKENLTFPTNDTLALYPYGLSRMRGHLVWLYTAGIFTKFFTEIFDWSVAKSIQFYPPIFGALSAIVIFLLTKEFFKDDKIALLASLFFACLPAVLYRTNSAFTDKEPIGQLFMILSLLFFVKSIKKFNWKYSILSAIFISLMGMTWGGYNIPYMVIGTFALILILFNIFDKSFYYTFLIFSVLSLILLTNYPTYYPISSIWFLPHYLAIFCFSLKFLDMKIKFSRKIEFARKRFGLFSIILSLIFGIILIAIYSPLRDKVILTISSLQAPLTAGVVGSTVAENRPSSLSEVSSQLGPVIGASAFGPIASAFSKIFSAFIFSIVGIFIICYLTYEKRFDFKLSLFLIIWYLISLYVGFAAVRAIFFSGFPVSVIGAFGFYYSFKEVSKYKFKNKNLNLVIKLGLWVIFSISIFFHLFTGYVFGQSLMPSMSKNWEDALVWIKEHSNKTDVILSWWDYGYIIQFYSQRPTYVDPGHPGIANDKTLFDAKSRDQQVAKFFMSTNETYYLDWLKSINVKYIVHDVTMIGKYSAVTKIGSWGNYIDNILILNFEEGECLEIGENNTCKKAIYKFGPVTLVQTPEITYAMLIQQNQARNVSKICTPDGIYLVDPNGLPGCVFIAKNAVAYIGIRCDSSGCKPYDLTNSLFVQMWFFDAKNLEHFKKVYDNGEVKVFEVIY